MALDFSSIKKSAASSLGKAAGIASEAAKTGVEAAATAAASGAVTLADAAESARSEINNRRYKPLFIDEYSDESFDCPKLIVVSDEDERKGVETCEGAIGWMRRDLKPEVMHLYEEFLPNSGLTFYPRAICDAAYFIDPYNPTRYIQLDQFLSVARRDQMTELKQIAHMLGAKECRLEYTEDSLASMAVKAKSSGGIKLPIPETPKSALSVNAESSSSFNRQDAASSKIVFEQVFEGDNEPSMPELKWYKNDNEIRDLIDTRLNSESNTTKSYRVEISSFASMCMSASQASKIDTSLGKAGVKGAFSLEGQYETEVRKKMTFEVVF